MSMNSGYAPQQVQQNGPSVIGFVVKLAWNLVVIAFSFTFGWLWDLPFAMKRQNSEDARSLATGVRWVSVVLNITGSLILAFAFPVTAPLLAVFVWMIVANRLHAQASLLVSGRERREASPLLGPALIPAFVGALLWVAFDGLGWAGPVTGVISGVVAVLGPVFGIFAGAGAAGSIVEFEKQAALRRLAFEKGAAALVGLVTADGLHITEPDDLGFVRVTAVDAPAAVTERLLSASADPAEFGIRVAQLPVFADWELYDVDATGFVLRDISEDAEALAARYRLKVSGFRSDADLGLIPPPAEGALSVNWDEFDSSPEPSLTPPPTNV